MKFTTRFIESLKPEDNRREVMETDRSGFGVRISTKGKKSWIYCYRFNGRTRRMTLGTFPEITLEKAHIEHAKAVESKVKGIDPGEKKVSENRESREANTVKELTEVYLKEIRGKKKTAHEDERTFNKDIIPAWGNRKANSITRREVRTVLKSIVERGSPIQANRTLAIIRRMFNWAISEDILLFNPCHGIQAPATAPQRDRILTPKEIKSLWVNLADCTFAKEIKLALKFQLVTIQRKGEIVNAERSEISLEDKIWTIPANKAKNGLTHRVPLSDIAIEIIEEAYALNNNSQWLFNSSFFSDSDEPIRPSSVDHAIRNNLKILKLKNVRPHDLRRTGASFMTSMGIPRLTVSKILNHSEKGVTAVYDRHSYDNEKTHALEAWASKVRELIEGEEQTDNVVKLIN